MCSSTHVLHAIFQPFFLYQSCSKAAHFNFLEAAVPLSALLRFAGLFLGPPLPSSEGLSEGPLPPPPPGGVQGLPLPGTNSGVDKCFLIVRYDMHIVLLWFISQCCVKQNQCDTLF